jgi:STE24 endopeptidase
MLEAMRTLFRIGLAVAAVVVATAVVVTIAAQPRGESRPEEKPPAAGAGQQYKVRVTDEMIRLSRLRNVLYFSGFGYSLAVLALVLTTGLSRRMRDAAARVTKRPFVMAFLYLALLSLATELLEFPLTYYAGFVVPHEYGLTTQSFGSWLGDHAKGLAAGIVVGGVIGALALMAVRKLKRWWLAVWAGSLPVAILLVALQPLVFDPLFNKFEPLRNEVLRRDLLELASRAGIEGGRVYQVNKSKQTTTMNAYVNGIGPTNRIVMWDTLLAKMTHDEVITVMGHEMGHYVMRHIWKGLAFGLAIAFPLLWLGQRIHDRGLAKWGARWGATAPGDPASTPWLLIIFLGGSFLISPIVNGFSRHIEHQADIFALDLTKKNEAFATAFIKLAEDSKRDPDPHPFIEFWRYTHPSINKRIAFALSYQPKE